MGVFGEGEEYVQKLEDKMKQEVHELGGSVA